MQADLNGAEPVLSELLPESELLLEGASVAGGSLFALYLDKAQSAVSQYDLSGKKLRDLKLPGIGAAAGFADNDQEPFTFYSFSEFTRPASIYRYDIATGESSVFKTPDLKFDPDRFTAEQVFFDSKDGTPVSMFLVHRKDMKLDGNNPTYLYGYGGLNISLTPGFTPLSVLLMEQGGIYAMVNLRGGGEYGEEWHRAGMLANKAERIRRLHRGGRVPDRQQIHVEGEAGDRRRIERRPARRSLGMTQRPDLVRGSIAGRRRDGHAALPPVHLRLGLGRGVRQQRQRGAVRLHL